MSLRGKFHLALISWLVAGPLIIFLLLPVSGYFGILLFAVMIAIGAYSMSLRCPVCAWRVGAINRVFYGPWAPKTCRNCGHSLTTVSK